MERLDQYPPVANLNGNDRAELVSSAREIHAACKDVLNALALSDLNHGRNFITAENGAHEQFNEIWFHHVKQVSDLQSQISAVAAELQRK